MEQATHVVDLLRFLIGEVVSVHAAGTRLDRGLSGDVDDACAATLRFDSGAVASLASTSLLGWKHRTRVDLFADGVAIHLAEDDLLVRRVDGEEHRVPGNDARSAADVAFIAAVRSGNPSDVRVPYDEAVRTHRFATAIARAALDGSVIELSGPAQPPEGRRVRALYRAARRRGGPRVARCTAGSGLGVRRHPLQWRIARDELTWYRGTNPMQNRRWTPSSASPARWRGRPVPRDEARLHVGRHRDGQPQRRRLGTANGRETYGTQRPHGRPTARTRRRAARRPRPLLGVFVAHMGPSARTDCCTRRRTSWVPRSVTLAMVCLAGRSSSRSRCRRAAHGAVRAPVRRGRGARRRFVTGAAGGGRGAGLRHNR